MIFERNIKDTDGVTVRGRTDADRFHSPWKTIDQTTFYELQGFRFLTRCHAGDRLTQKPCP